MNLHLKVTKLVPSNPQVPYLWIALTAAAFVLALYLPHVGCYWLGFCSAIMIDRSLDRFMAYRHDKSLDHAEGGGE
jgi:hypothetical protein